MKSLRGGGGRAAGQFDGRSGQQNGGSNSQHNGCDGRAQGQGCMGSTEGVKTSYGNPQQSGPGGRGKLVRGNNPSGNLNGSSGNNSPGSRFPEKFPGNGSSGNQPPGKRPPCNKLSGNNFPGTLFPDNKFSGTGPSGSGSFGNRPPGNGPPGNRLHGNELPSSIQDGKREALQLCKGRVGNNEQRGAVLKSSKSDTGREKPTFVFGGNLSTVPSTSESRTPVKTPANQAQPAHLKKIPDLAKALQTAVKETVSDSVLHTTTNLKVGPNAARLNSETMSRSGGGGQHQEERMKQLEQRVGYLEQQLVKEKAAKETLLASVERALLGEAVEETCSELKLVRLIQDVRTKVLGHEQPGQMVSLDLNGNETLAEGSSATKYCKSGSPTFGRILHADVGTKARLGEASNMVKQNPGVAIIY